jgi:hypothetical protein
MSDDPFRIHYTIDSQFLFDGYVCMREHEEKWRELEAAQDAAIRGAKAEIAKGDG